MTSKKGKKIDCALSVISFTASPTFCYVKEKERGRTRSHQGVHGEIILIRRFKRVALLQYADWDTTDQSVPRSDTGQREWMLVSSQRWRAWLVGCILMEFLFPCFSFCLHPICIAVKLIQSHPHLKDSTSDSTVNIMIKPFYHGGSLVK